MKISKKIFVGMAVLVLSFGLMLTGCGTPPVRMETETSRTIFEVASELVAEQEGGITAGELLSGLENRISGLRRSPLLSIQVDLIQVVYGGSTFVITCVMPDLAIRDEAATATVERAGTSTIVSSITAVYAAIQSFE